MSQIAAIQLCDVAGQAGDKLRLRSWIEVQLIGEDDSPIPNEAYELRLPGGELISGTGASGAAVKLLALTHPISSTQLPFASAMSFASP